MTANRLMSTGETDIAPGRSRRRAVGFWWLLISATAVAVFAPLPYLTGSLTTMAADNQIAAIYANAPQWVRIAFYVHIVGGGAALLLSPLQFAARLRDRFPRVHRMCGRVAFTSIGLGAIAGLLLAPRSAAGTVGTLGFGALAVLWFTFALTAYRAIRRRDVTAHRRWAVRAFALTYAAVTLRLWLGVLITSQIALGGVDGDTAFTRAYLLVPFLSWVPNLIVAELLIRGTRRRPRL